MGRSRSCCADMISYIGLCLFLSDSFTNDDNQRGTSSDAIMEVLINALASYFKLSVSARRPQQYEVEFFMKCATDHLQLLSFMKKECYVRISYPLYI